MGRGFVANPHVLLYEIHVPSKGTNIFTAVTFGILSGTYKSFNGTNNFAAIIFENVAGKYRNHALSNGNEAGMYALFTV